jgi:hypothetical protein
MINAGDYGGPRNRFILYRKEYEGKMVPVDPNNTVDTQPQPRLGESQAPIIAMEVSTDDSEEQAMDILDTAMKANAPQLIKNFFQGSLWNNSPGPSTSAQAMLKAPVVPQLQLPIISENDFIQQGIGNLNRAQYPYAENPRALKLNLQHRTKMPILISVVTPKGKRIDLDNEALISFQKKADGHGKLTIKYDAEDVEFDINQIMQAVKKGQRAILIEERKTAVQPSTSPAPKTIQKQLNDVIDKNKKK